MPVGGGMRLIKMRIKANKVFFSNNARQNLSADKRQPTFLIIIDALGCIIQPFIIRLLLGFSSS